MYLMRPQTFALMTIIVLLALMCHTFEYWLRCVSRSTLKFLKRVNVGLSIATSALGTLLPNVECITGIASNNVVHELKARDVAVYALQGRRPKMEDRFSYVNETQRLGIQFWAVYDGHGGDSAANYLESHLYSAISKRVLQLSQKSANSDNSFCQKPTLDYIVKDNDGPTAECSHNALNREPLHKYRTESLSVSSLSHIVTEEVLQIDKQLVEDSKKRYDVAGSTALIALRIAEQNKLIVANVGDSRGVMCDVKGAAIPLSFDHKPQQLKEHKRIKEAGGFIKFNGVWRVAGILATSRALGDYPLKERNLVIADPDILTFDLNDMAPQFMILASDGLWDTFTNEEAVTFIKDNLIKLKQNNSQQMAFDAAKSIVLESYKRGSVDNITVILVIFDSNLLNHISNT